MTDPTMPMYGYPSSSAYDYTGYHHPQQQWGYTPESYYVQAPPPSSGPSTYASHPYDTPVPPPSGRRTLHSRQRLHHRSHDDLFAGSADSQMYPDAQLFSGGPREPPAKNQLDLDAIESGADTRTTVMVKNIPNKMSDRDLLGFIGRVCPRRIDFLYLRMDFQNGVFPMIATTMRQRTTADDGWDRLQCWLRVRQLHYGAGFAAFCEDAAWR